MSIVLFLGSIPSVPKKFSEEKIVDVAEVNQWRCLEESGLWLENVDQTHLVLASVYYKKIVITIVCPSLLLVRLVASIISIE